jgi:hypothetical protein
MTPAKYVLQADKNGTYRLVIHGAVKFEGLTFDQAVAKIYKSENGEYPGDLKEDQLCWKSR